MNQRKSILYLLFSLFSITAFSQNAVVSAGGEAESLDESHASYTVGEAIYSEIESSEGSSFQGIQQPFTIIVPPDGLHEEDDLSISVYPNPTVNSLFLEVKDYEDLELSYHMYDELGKDITHVEISQELTEIPMDNLSSGTYYIEVWRDKKSIRTYPIIKNH